MLLVLTAQPHRVLVRAAVVVVRLHGAGDLVVLLEEHGGVALLLVAVSHVDADVGYDAGALLVDRSAFGVAGAGV